MSHAAIRSGNVINNDDELEIECSNVTFPSCGVVLSGLLLRPVGVPQPLPAIALAPGMSGVKEGSILKFAEKFARGGFIVLAYDNINFGESEGEAAGLSGCAEFPMYAARRR